MCLPRACRMTWEDITRYHGDMVDEHAMTVRLDDGQYQQLRREAYERDVSRSDIIREALDAHFKEYFKEGTP